MKKLIIVIAALGALVVGCGSPSQTNPTTLREVYGTPTSTATRPGDPAVYARIESLTDCNAIRKEWDTAIANTKRNLDAAEAARESGNPDPSRLRLADITLSYQNAAEARMHATGCYGKTEGISSGGQAVRSVS